MLNTEESTDLRSTIARDHSTEEMKAQLLYLLSLLLCACSKHTVSIQKDLCAGSVKYWVASTGYNWAFHSNGSFTEYEQDTSGRHRVDYGDVIITQMNYAVTDLDSLVLNAGSNRLWAYKLGKKPLDHLVYEGHLIASRSLARGLERLGVTGFESLDVRTQRRPPSENFVWLRIAGDFPRFDPSSTGYEIEDCCPACQRAGHYGNWSQGESPCAAVPTANADMNLSWEYYGNWRQTRRTEDGWVPVGGFRTIVVSRKARWAFIQLGVRRIVWVPMRTAPPAG